MNRKLIFRAVLVACTIALSACKDKNALIIEGTVTNPGKVRTAILLRTDSTQVNTMNIVDSVALTDGKFSFKRVAPNPELYKVLFGGLAINAIGKNGDDIKINVDMSDTSCNYKVTGSEASEQMRIFDRYNFDYGNASNAINALYKAAIAKAHTKADSTKINNFFIEKFDAQEDAYSAKLLKFMKDNQNNIASFYAALTLDKYKYEQQLVAYADSIKGKWDNNFAIRDFVKAMMEIKPVTVGHKAPDFTLIDADNKPVKLSDYKGKYLLIDFWASWCGPCRQENPNVVKAYGMYKDKGLNILGISLDDNRTEWQTAIAQDKLSWRHASEFKRFDGPTVKH